MGRFLHDKDRRAPILNVVNWFLLVVAVLSVLTRLGTKLWMFHRFTSDDYLIVVSLVCVTDMLSRSHGTKLIHSRSTR